MAKSTAKKCWLYTNKHEKTLKAGVKKANWLGTHGVTWFLIIVTKIPGKTKELFISDHSFICVSLSRWEYVTEYDISYHGSQEPKKYKSGSKGIKEGARERYSS